ncbi:hypothetical protein ACFL6S_09070 [Candidatus Poribacteria bacterium]
MKFSIYFSYNLDLLNLMNVLTGEEFYVGCHRDAFARFGGSLSDDSQHHIKEAVDINSRGAMLGPFLCLVISAVPNFERRSVTRMFSDANLLKQSFSQYRYFSSEKWPMQKSIFRLLLPVVRELEAKGFREYWLTNRLPLLEEARRELSRFVYEFELQDEIEYMLGPGQTIDSITLYLCTFAAPHGIKLCGPCYISDVAFPKAATLSAAIHEMFHPPYDANNLENELAKLGMDPLLKHAFETKDPKYGYPTMTGFIEENVVEAMALSICQRIGLGEDPLGYLLSHDDGSHVLSVILLEYFKRYPKLGSQTFEEYFRDLLKRMPIGELDVEYEFTQHRM